LEREKCINVWNHSGGVGGGEGEVKIKEGEPTGVFLHLKEKNRGWGKARSQHLKQ